MTDKDIIKAVDYFNDEYSECNDCSFSGKEYAKQMRENAVTDKNGNVIVSEELWQQIANIIETQQAEIEKARAEAIREFAEEFDDVLAAMRDEYAHFGRPEYGLVCEVVHHKLFKTVKEMVGTDNG